MKLFFKLYIYLLIGILALISVEGWLNYRIEVDQFDEDMKRNAIQVGKLMTALVEHSWAENGEQKTAQLIQDTNTSKSQFSIRWVSLPNSSDKEHLQPSIDVGSPIPIPGGTILSIKKKLSPNSGFRYTYFPLKLENHDASAIELAQTLDPLYRFSRKMLIRSFNIAGLILLISGAILYCYMNRQIRKRLILLSKKAKQIGRGEIQPDLHIHGNDELSELADTVNNMCRELLAAKNKLNSVHEARIKTLEQLRHTERLSTIGHITAGIAHELGTPLNIVSGRAKMVTQDDMPIEEIRENAEIIRCQSDRMTTIIRQLLDFSRRRKLRYASTNINSLVLQVFDILYPFVKKQNVTLQLAKHSETQILTIDPNQIQQVLVNLIMNSIQAMPDGGKTEVDIFKKTMCDPETEKSGLYTGISVSDTGTGIDNETMKHIFEPFFTTKRTGEGTGLGLSIIQGIIEEHHGWIDVESQKGSGATFTFYLPMETDE